VLVTFYHSMNGDVNPGGGKTAAGGGDDFASLLARGLNSPGQRLSSSSPLVWRRGLSGAAGRSALAQPAFAQSAESRPYYPSSGLPSQMLSDEHDRPPAKPLGAPYSSYSGNRFTADIGRGEPQRVGAGLDQFHFPHLVEKDGTYHAYFIDHTDGSPNDVGLATSTDGVNFEYQGKVLGKGEGFDDLQASFPGVAYDGDSDTWYMLYEGRSSHEDMNSVCLATSPDGVNWTKHGPVIRPNDAGQVSNVDVGTPTMFKEDGAWHVYFHTYGEDGRVRIGYASGESLSELNVRQGPLLDTDAAGLEAGTVGARSNVVKAGDYYYMAYEVCTALNDFAQAEWGTNLARATSPDGPWEKMETPLLVNKYAGFGCDGPELMVEGDKVWLYYRYGANNTARTELTGLGEGAAMAHQTIAPPEPEPEIEPEPQDQAAKQADADNDAEDQAA